jgi:hypothetical protein
VQVLLVTMLKPSGGVSKPRPTRRRKTMKRIHIFAAVAVVSLAGCSSFPGPSARQADEHDGHHPGAESAPQVDAARGDRQMKAMHEMQEMHQKMMAAKTPAERAALMKDHMKAMQDGMAMMGQMGARMPIQRDGKAAMTDRPSHRENMMQRMDMMEMMMQMMVDREAARPPAR